MAGRAAGLIVVIDASTFVSAALKANTLPERALLRAVDPSNRLILSQAVEDEYREVIFRRSSIASSPPSGASGSSTSSLLRPSGSSRLKPCGSVATRRTTSTWRWLPPAGRMSS
jgi:hypothetical protein